MAPALDGLAMECSSVAELTEVFDLIDLDGDGRITAAELGKLLRAIGVDGQDPDAVVAAMMAQADVNGDGTIDLEEFIRVNQAAVPHALVKSGQHGATTEEKWRAEMRTVFHAFDVDGNGVITASELHNVLGAVWDRKGGDSMLDGNDEMDGVTAEECERIVQAADSNGDGVLDFDEFVRIMQGSSLLKCPQSPAGVPTKLPSSASLTSSSFSSEASGSGSS